jgi:hypothetical protein
MQISMIGVEATLACSGAPEAAIHTSEFIDQLGGGPEAALKPLARKPVKERGIRKPPAPRQKYFTLKSVFWDGREY